MWRCWCWLSNPLFPGAPLTTFSTVHSYFCKKLPLRKSLFVCTLVLLCAICLYRCVLDVQITGFTDVDTATLNLCFNVGNAVGMATGGILGDLLSRRFPRFARPLVNQVLPVLDVYAVLDLQFAGLCKVFEPQIYSSCHENIALSCVHRSAWSL